MPDFDAWCNDAAARCAKQCGLAPDRVTVRTDYCSVWVIKYEGELTLAQLIRVARFMDVEHDHDGGTPARHLMTSIYDDSGRIANPTVVEGLAKHGCYPLNELAPDAPVLTRYERLRNVDPQECDPHT